jgi:hypothetical protein
MLSHHIRHAVGALASRPGFAATAVIILTIGIGATTTIFSHTRHEGLEADADPAAFLPQHQGFFNLGIGFERTMTLVIRTGSDAASLTSLLRTSVASIDPQLPTASFVRWTT